MDLLLTANHVVPSFVLSTASCLLGVNGRVMRYLIVYQGMKQQMESIVAHGLSKFKPKTVARVVDHWMKANLVP